MENIVNDNELLELSDMEEAERLLIQKYSPIVRKCASVNLGYAKTSGLDEKDLYQEGLLGLLYAIKNFDKDKNVTFYTYASICIETNIRSAIRSANRQKSKILNESISLDKLFEEDNYNLYSLIKDEESDPSKQLIKNESNENLFTKLNNSLTDFEREVLKLKKEGLTNSEISVILEKDKRSIENTITRIRNKYKELK